VVDGVGGVGPQEIVSVAGCRLRVLLLEAGGWWPFLSHPSRTVGQVEPIREDVMLIDCNECAMQHTPACHDCVVTHLLRDVLGPIEVDPEQHAALEVLAEVGLVPGLRLIRRVVNE
jgi:hypothetical protein